MSHGSTVAAKRRRQRNAEDMALQARRLTKLGFLIALQDGATLIATAPSRRKYQITPKGWRLVQGAGQPAGRIVDEIITRESIATAQAKRRVDVTVFADASWCWTTKAGGWGAWIKGGAEAAITGGGPMEALVESSVEAEMRALTNAVALGIARGVIQEGHAVMLQSDCVNALKWILGAYGQAHDRPAGEGVVAAGRRHYHSAKAKRSAGLAKFVEQATSLQLVVLTRHVRGHQQDDGRQFVNRTCDAIARRHMQVRRARERREGSDASDGADIQPVRG